MDVLRRASAARLPTSVAALVRTAGRALTAAGAPSPASIGLVLSDDAELSDLNARHMGESGPTDVLSFPLLPPSAFAPHPGQDALTAGQSRLEPDYALPPGQRPHLGDIVISVERAIDQAHLGQGGQSGNITWSAAEELRLLVIHGVLHLCGWDHADETEREAMRALEREVLSGR